MLMNVVDDDVAYPFLHILASVLAWASAVINPFIYAFKNKQYQQAFAKVRLICLHGSTFCAYAYTINFTQSHLRIRPEILPLKYRKEN